MGGLVPKVLGRLLILPCWVVLLVVVVVVVLVLVKLLVPSIPGSTSISTRDNDRDRDRVGGTNSGGGTKWIRSSSGL
jgi:hypothetical protein